MDHLYSPKDIISSGLCIGCGSCVAQSKQEAAHMKWDGYGQLKPQGAPQWMQERTAGFSKTCPFSPAALNEDLLAEELYPIANQKDIHLGRFQTAYVGHVAEQDFRLKGSSGGMVSWVAAELLRNGLIDGVAHVSAVEDPHNAGKYFSYKISRSVEEIQQGAKSRYYPIELSQVLRTISEAPGRYAVIGVPCFIKAIQLLRRQDPVLRERIRFTLGLFCGHMKSARFVDSFAWQMDVPRDKVKKVEYRHKDPSRPANWYNARLTLTDGHEVNRDWWHLADGDWGAGFFMNSACNFCDDVVGETADISFGDAWVEPYSSDGKGTNVAVVRSAVIGRLIDTAIAQQRLHLTVVDAAFVRQTQEAGFRQRREGLAYRLTWKRSGVQPRKRVTPNANIDKKRKLIYRMRYEISAWSHRIAKVAGQTRIPQFYVKWAGAALALYQGMAYQRGKLGRIINKLGLN